MLRVDLARAADGERTALEPAFTRLHPLVLGFCRRMLDGPTAEDASQEALVNLFAHASEYDSGREPVLWALAFAANAYRTARKRVIRRHEQGEVPERWGEGDPQAQLLEAELRAAVMATVATLFPLDAETPSHWRWDNGQRAPPSASAWSGPRLASGRPGSCDEPSTRGGRRL